MRGIIQRGGRSWCAGVCMEAFDLWLAQKRRAATTADVDLACATAGNAQPVIICSQAQVWQCNCRPGMLKDTSARRPQGSRILQSWGTEEGSM